MKNISLLKTLFFIHLVAFSAYFYYQIKIKKEDTKLQSHLIKIDTSQNQLQTKPIGLKVQDNSAKEESEEKSQEKIKNEDDFTSKIISRFGPNYITPPEKLSALMLIIQENRNDLFKKHLSEFKNIDHQNIYGASALVMAASSSDMLYVNELLKMGANPNIKFNKKNFTILMDAAMEGNTELVTTLLNHGAKINEVDNTGKSALIYASIEGHGSVIQALLKNGANKKIKDIKNLTALDYLIRNSHKSLYDLLK